MEAPQHSRVVSRQCGLSLHRDRQGSIWQCHQEAGEARSAGGQGSSCPTLERDHCRRAGHREGAFGSYGLFDVTNWFVSGFFGVGTETPTYKAEVLDDTNAPLNQTVLWVSRQAGASNFNTYFQVENYTNEPTAGSHMRLARAQGTRGSSAAVADGDRLGLLIYSG